jgi:hypothetical protein
MSYFGMPTALLIILAAGLAAWAVGVFLVILGIRNAPEATETENGFEVIRAPRKARRAAATSREDDDAKLHGTNPQFS